jgi:hypothetical protein
MSASTSPKKGATLTIVSGFAATTRRSGARIVGLVRSSHLWPVVVLTLLTSGCLYQEPPDWGAPQRTTPQLISPLPSPTKIIPISSKLFDGINGTTSLHISVNEYSEDNGDGIRAITFLYYDTKDVTFKNIFEVNPGHIQDEKHISVNWDVPPDSSPHTDASACLPLTLVVTHASSVENTTQHLPKKDASEDVASITWILSFNNPDPEVTCTIPDP